MADEETQRGCRADAADEFRCSRCFLVHHRSQRVTARDGSTICRDCASIQVARSPAIMAWGRTFRRDHVPQDMIAEARRTIRASRGTPEAARAGNLLVPLPRDSGTAI